MKSLSVEADQRDDRSWSPSAANAAWTTSDGSWTGASSTNQIPWGN